MLLNFTLIRLVQALSLIRLVGKNGVFFRKHRRWIDLYKRFFSTHKMQWEAQFVVNAPKSREFRQYLNLMWPS